MRISDWSSDVCSSDLGGTFTDLVYYEVDPATGQCGAVRTAKADTTPPNFDEGVLNALDKSGVPISRLDFFAHGSTVVINALTERKGVKTALNTTKGFPAVNENASGHRPTKIGRASVRERRGTYFIDK